MNRSYYRIRLGKNASYADECLAGGYIGVGWGFTEDLSGQFGDDWRDFNLRYRPVYMARHPEKTMVAAGLACGMLWTVGRGMNIGDIVMCPDANGAFMLGEVSSDYYCVSEGIPTPASPSQMVPKPNQTIRGERGSKKVYKRPRYGSCRQRLRG